MNIEIRCNSCSKNLTIRNKIIVPGADVLRLDVTPCGSRGCTNCVDCEDMELLKKVQEELAKLRSKVANLQRVVR